MLFTTKTNPRALPGPRRLLVSRPARGSVLIMTLIYSLMFAALASSMVAYSYGNMSVQQAESNSTRALAAAESGMNFLRQQFHNITLPSITEGSISSMSTPSQLWSSASVEGISGNKGIAVALASALNSSGAFSSASVNAPSGTSPLNVPAVIVDPNGDQSSFTLSLSYDAANPQTPASAATPAIVLHAKSVGAAGNISRTVTMDFWIQKQLKYAVYSNVAIQLGKNVRVVGDIASTYPGTGKGPTVQMFDDWHYLPNMSQLDTDLTNFRNLLNTYNTGFDNRLDVRDPTSAAAIAAKNAGFADTNGDGYIDDYDLAMNRINPSWSRTNPYSNAISSGQFTNPNTGNPYDADLWTLIDDPLGALVNGKLPDGSLPPWTGYDDNVLSNADGYAKVNGSVKAALSYAAWQSAASGWSAYGDTSGGATGKNFRDQFEGSVVPSDPTAAPVQLGVDFSGEQTLAPSNFDTSAYDAQVPSTTASKRTVGGVTTISNGNLTSSMANGGTTTEHSPASATSGWQATYSRPVFQNVVFNNVRIPKGLNAKFINCTFNGYTSVKMTTKIVSPNNSQNTNPDGSTSDPNGGMAWAQQMNSGIFSANTTLTSSNSVAYANGNNLHFSGCTFNGVMTADIPTSYTHFADSWEFDGNTTMNNQVDQTVTIMAPQTNIEMGGFTNPGANPSTLVGVVVAGNIDIRGTATVDGSLLVTGNGAGNTTLGYFGSTDSGNDVPSPSELPSGVSSYGHLFFRFNPGRGMPNGITIPVVASAQINTYQIQ
ncbi:MAG TPA: hypothetical protein VH253_10045 [Phycisphaerae bacterium]|nr:hypothetical protein [Phycisphaerae bacterium]